MPIVHDPCSIGSLPYTGCLSGLDLESPLTEAIQIFT